MAALAPAGGTGPCAGPSQAGLVNNLNDDLTWGVFPLLFASRGAGLAAIGLIKGVCPLLWGAGRLSDTLGRKPLIVTGMLVQAAEFPAALWMPGGPLAAGIASAVLLGAGTAMAYPALIAAVAAGGALTLPPGCSPPGGSPGHAARETRTGRRDG